MEQMHNWNFPFKATERQRKEKQKQKKKGVEAEFGERAGSQAGVAANQFAFCSVSLVEMRNCMYGSVPVLFLSFSPAAPPPPPPIPPYQPGPD